MGFGQELKDFVSAFKTGSDIYETAQSRRDTKESKERDEKYRRDKFEQDKQDTILDRKYKYDTLGETKRYHDIMGDVYKERANEGNVSPDFGKRYTPPDYSKPPGSPGADKTSSNDSGALPITQASYGGGVGQIRNGIIQTAEAIGIDPVDLATAISYETGGTFNPTQAGPTTQWGRHRGLIQFGEPQARENGVDWSNPVGSQLGPNGAIANYLRKAGVKPGMGMLDVYSAINAGRVGRAGASDANNGGAPGTVADKVNNQMGAHRRRAMQLLEGYAPSSGGSGAQLRSASARDDDGSLSGRILKASNRTSQPQEEEDDTSLYTTGTVGTGSSGGNRRSSQWLAEGGSVEANEPDKSATTTTKPKMKLSDALLSGTEGTQGTGSQPQGEMGDIVSGVRMGLSVDGEKLRGVGSKIKGALNLAPGGRVSDEEIQTNNMTPQGALELGGAREAAAAMPKGPQQIGDSGREVAPDAPGMEYSSLGQAIGDGLRYMAKKFGLNGGVENQQGQQAFNTGVGAADHEELKAVNDKVDPERKLQPSERNRRAIESVYTHFNKNGNPEAGAAGVASLMQAQKMIGANMAAEAEKAFQAGDVAAGVNWLTQAYDQVPNGMDFQAKVRPDGQVDYRQVDAKGKVVMEGVATPQQIAEIAKRAKTGSIYNQEVINLAGQAGPPRRPEGLGQTPVEQQQATQPPDRAVPAEQQPAPAAPTPAPAPAEGGALPVGNTPGVTAPTTPAAAPTPTTPGTPPTSMADQQVNPATDTTADSGPTEGGTGKPGFNVPGSTDMPLRPPAEQGGTTAVAKDQTRALPVGEKPGAPGKADEPFQEEEFNPKLSEPKPFGHPPPDRTQIWNALNPKTKGERAEAQRIINDEEQRWLRAKQQWDGEQKALRDNELYSAQTTYKERQAKRRTEYQEKQANARLEKEARAKQDEAERNAREKKEQIETEDRRTKAAARSALNKPKDFGSEERERMTEQANTSLTKSFEDSGVPQDKQASEFRRGDRDVMNDGVVTIQSYNSRVGGKTAANLVNHITRGDLDKPGAVKVRDLPDDEYDRVEISFGDGSTIKSIHLPKKDALQLLKIREDQFGRWMKRGMTETGRANLKTLEKEQSDAEDKKKFGGPGTKPKNAVSFGEAARRHGQNDAVAGGN